MKKILITGSSGQIGTNLALLLLEKGHAVWGIDRRPNPWTDKIPTFLQDLSVATPGFHQDFGLPDLPPDLDLVVHFAAHAKVHELVEQPQRALANVTMTFNVLEFCRHHHLPLLFSSTREVYGDIHHYITEESYADFAYTESPYSASKIAGEAFVYAYARCYGLRYLVFRFSNVYGRYDNDLERMERVIPLFIRKIAQEEPITIYGEDKLLDFTYVDDCVDGVLRGIALLLSDKEANHTINLAYGQGNSLVDLATYIGGTLGKEPNISVKPTRKGEVTRYVANIGRARALLGYHPQTSLAEGIPKAVAWSLQWQELAK
ncbi:MAG: NAD-dependent epimerase/dehydratase family protein [Caldilineaceae bacterium]|nr:NAD-dependent epimerase/dehydratase family protein [Caldilineaceae bacterium]